MSASLSRRLRRIPLQPTYDPSQLQDEEMRVITAWKAAHKLRLQKECAQRRQPKGGSAK